MLLLGGGLLPTSLAQGLATLALVTSCVNIGGGFTITQRCGEAPEAIRECESCCVSTVANLIAPPRMLAMFKRPTDPEEHNYLLALPTALLVSCCLAGYRRGFAQLVPITYLAASALCIAAIGCLASMKTALLGNALGLAGVTAGMAATACLVAPSGPLAVQMGGSIVLGLALGSAVAAKMKITDLPQAVAAFHSLVRGPGCRTSSSQLAHVAASATASECRWALRRSRRRSPTTCWLALTGPWTPCTV